MAVSAGYQSFVLEQLGRAFETDLEGVYSLGTAAPSAG